MIRDPLTPEEKEREGAAWAEFDRKRAAREPEPAHLRGILMDAEFSYGNDPRDAILRDAQPEAAL